MLEKMIMGRYLPIDSLMHRLDPRTKITFVFAFVILIFFANNLVTYGVTILFVVAITATANVSPKYLLNGIKLVLVLIIFTFLLHVFFTKQGEVLFQIGSFKVYLGGIQLGAMIALRFILLVVMTTLLTLTTTPLEITDGLESILAPLKKMKVPVHEIALMLSIALRFIPTLLQETDKIMKAQTARGVEFSSGSLKSRIMATVPLLIPLFVSAFKRAEELAIAMEARGYRGDIGRTKYRVLQMKAIDFIFLAAILLLGILIFTYRTA